MFSSSAPAKAAPPARKPEPAAATHAAAPAAAAHPPAVAAPAAPPAVMGAAPRGGLMSTVMDGLAFGTGSAIAHRAVGALFGGGGGGAAAAAPAAEAAAPAAAAAAPPSFSAARSAVDCTPFQRDFTTCLQENRSDIASCQIYMDSFNQCTADAKLS